MTPGRTLEAARRDGMAAACVLILATKRLPSTITYADLIRMVGCTNREAVDAVARFKDRARQRQGLPPVQVTENGRLAQRQSRRAPGPAPDGTKWCGQGEHFAPLTEFSTNRAAPDGLQNMCKPCRRLYDRERTCPPRSRRPAPMTITVEHVRTAHSGNGTTPRYRCHCGATFPDPGAAHQCRHRLRPVPVMPDRHEPAQLTMEVPDA